jgi:hypothetical protein
MVEKYNQDNKWRNLNSASTQKKIMRQQRKSLHHQSSIC